MDCVTRDAAQEEAAELRGYRPRRRAEVEGADARLRGECRLLIGDKRFDASCVLGAIDVLLAIVHRLLFPICSEAFPLFFSSDGYIIDCV